MPQLFRCAGTGAQVAAWTIAFRAEAAAISAQEHAVALLHLVKVFEKMPRHVLVIAATRKGYPLVLLRLSLAAYCLPTLSSMPITIGSWRCTSMTLRSRLWRRLW